MSQRTRAHTPAPGWLVWTALGIVYLVWGSTYLAIRVTVETMPPLLTAAVRFMLAGAIAYAAVRMIKGAPAVRVTKREVGASTIVGSLLLLGGNGLVSIGELEVPSALAALIIASVPLWVVLWRRVTREHIPLGTLAGVAVGFAGVAYLVLPGDKPGGASLGYMLLIVIASMSWATGSFFSKRLPLPQDPFVSTAMQMLTGGAVMVVAGLVRGELSGLDTADFSAASLWAFVYLVFAGSLLAFTAYVWLLQHAPISKVATYAYVNPVVALFLGWLILDEAITLNIMIGAAIIVAAVAWIIRMESKVARQAAVPEAILPPGIPSEREVRLPDEEPAGAQPG
jgi:drug/metabolite transporter (DMT)-like permease